MKKIMKLLLMMILIITSASVSVEVKAESEEVVACEHSSTDILFSNGYKGFCIDEHDKVAGSNTTETQRYPEATDKFTVISAEDVKSNLDDTNVSQKIKVLFVYFFEEIFSLVNGEYVFADARDSLVQSVIWNYTDNRYIWGEQVELKKKIEAFDAPTIPDSGFQRVLENGDIITFHFAVMKPKNQAVQHYFAYKLDVAATNSSPTAATIRLVWDDSDNQEGKRPESLVATLSNGMEVTLNEEKNWSATIGELPADDTLGQTITYAWTVGALPEGYSVSSSISEDTVTTLTLSYQEVVPEETVEASVKVVWDDGDNQDGKRPESLVATLSNGMEVTLNEENNWSATIEELSKNNEDGDEILYTWTINGIPDVYNLTANDVEGTETVLTYKHIPETIDLTLKFVWNDENNQDNTRPTSLNVLLNDERPHILSEENNWTLTLLELPKYKSGEEIKYIWTVTELPEGYTSPEIEETNDISLTVFTSSYEPQKPVEPSVPGDSGEGGAGVQPSEPSIPGDSGEDGAGVQPSEPQDPTNPSVPENPTESGDSVEDEKEEMPIVPEEPKNPQVGAPDTGDYSNVTYYLIMLAVACFVILERMLACVKQK